jgi:hypothetical protein
VGTANLNFNGKPLPRNVNNVDWAPSNLLKANKQKSKICSKKNNDMKSKIENMNILMDETNTIPLFTRRK